MLEELDVARGLGDGGNEAEIRELARESDEMVEGRRNLSQEDLSGFVSKFDAFCRTES